MASYRRAEFERTLELLGEAERSSLDREGVVTLLRLRALVRYATEDRQAMREDLGRLAALGEGPADAPPPVRSAYEEAVAETTPLELVTEVVDLPGGVTVTATVTGDHRDLVEAVRVGARSGDVFQEATDDAVTVPVNGGTEVAHYARALGPGGAVLLADGTPDDPRVHVVTGPAPTNETEPLEEDTDTTLVWGLVGIAAVIVAAGAVVAVILLGGDDEDPGTQLSGPRLEL